MAESKVHFNLKNVHYAVRTSGGAGSVVAVPGAISLDLTPQGESTILYADGIAYYKTQSNQGYSGDLEMARFPDQMRQDIWNTKIQSTDKTLYELASAEPAVFDLGFQIDGDAQERLVWLYGCTATRPNINAATVTETKEVQTETTTITSSPLANGLTWSMTTDQTTTATRAAWFSAVYEPTIS